METDNENLDTMVLFRLGSWILEGALWKRIENATTIGFDWNVPRIEKVQIDKNRFLSFSPSHLLIAFSCSYSFVICT